MTALEQLRKDGWSVAVHNDYNLDGQHHTFWLLTKGDRFIKGEGRTDDEALTKAQAAAISAVCGEGQVTLQEHTKEVGLFLQQLYAILVDPIAEGEIKVPDMMKALLDAANNQREAVHNIVTLSDQKARHKSLARLKGACACAHGFPITTSHGYAGENADAWMEGFKYCQTYLGAGWPSTADATIYEIATRYIEKFNPTTDGERFCFGNILENFGKEVSLGLHKQSPEHYKIMVPDNTGSKYVTQRGQCVCGGAVADGVTPYQHIWDLHIEYVLKDAKERGRA